MGQHHIGPVTVEDWLTHEDLDDGSRVELVRGHLHVTPLPHVEHQYACGELCALLKESLRDAGRMDLYPVCGVAARISARRRIGLIPDVVVVNRRPFGPAADPEDLVLVAEVWSPGNTRAERAATVAEYGLAGVPYLWEVHQDRFGACTVTASYLEDGRYLEELTAKPGRDRDHQGGRAGAGHV